MGGGSQPPSHGVTAPAAAAGVKWSRETAFIEADALPLSNSSHVRTQRSGGLTEAEPTRDQGRSLGRIWTTSQPAETIIRDKFTTVLTQVERDNKVGCDLMLQQRGPINPKLYTS